MSNKLFKSLFAFAMVLGAALGFVSCETAKEEPKADPKVELSASTVNFASAEASQTVNITSNSNWEVEVEESADWVTIAPMSGKNNGTITIAVSENTTGAVRSTVVKVFALHETYGRYDTKKLTVSQSADDVATVDEELLYSDNFDGEVAKQDSDSKWPFIDKFPQFANAEGPAAANVTYTGAGVSVRANSTSSSSYSDYEGSGSNNIFFGGGAYFVINNIAPLKEGHKEYKLTFGTEKYTQDGDSTFRNDEFIVSLSKDGEKWAEIEYTYAGTEPGRWNVATANFSLNEVPEALYIKFEAKVASVYRLDDVKLFVSNGGQVVDLDNIVVVEPERPTTDALYFENFDGKGASQDSSGYWPYIADFPEFINAAGPAAATVNYTGYNATVRNNSNSNNSYSDYEGSGVNNIFFGKDNAWFAINELTMESTQNNLVLTFGTEKFTQSGDSTFKNTEFLVSISGDGEKWSNVEYTFAGTEPARWNVATANFTLAEVPAKLYIKFTATAASVYRLDDVTLDLGEGGKVIDLANGVVEEPSNPDQPVNPDQPNVPAAGVYESDSAFVCAEDNSTLAAYSLGSSTVNGASVSGFKLGTGKLSGYFKSGVVSVEGAKYLNFYAVAWKDKEATLYYRVDGGEATAVTLTANDGATGNPPYTITGVDANHYSVLLEGLTATSTIEFSTDATFTAASNTTSGRAVVFGVKLTDEALGAETPSEPENPGTGEDPETPVDPAGVITIAEVLALGQGATINGVIEGVVVSNLDLNNLTSKKGMYVQDETGALQFFFSANHSFAFGTKVQIDLSGCTLGNYNGAVQVSGIATEKVTVLSTGNAVEAKSVSMADFLANKYEGQYIALEGVQVASSDLANTWVVGGAHTSINMEDAQGNKFVVFSSKYATYAAETVAQGAGTIKGIASINSGNIQIIFAQATDYAGLTGERFDGVVTPDPTPDPEPTPDPTPGDGTYAGRDDFNTIAWNSSYLARTSTAGWVGENCAVQAGGAADANPVFPSILGSSEDARAWVINGKTSAVGKITSPVITTGCGTLTFNYAMAFSENNGFNFTVDILQNGVVVKSFDVVDADNTKFAVKTFNEDVNVAGDFQIVITNNCPSATNGNKDRYSIWDVMWTAQN